MLLFFLGLLLFLSNGMPSLQPLTNNMLDDITPKSNGTASLLNMVHMVMNHKKEPSSLLSAMSNVDPTALSEVVTLIEALLAASQNELAALLQASDDASTAYDDATAAYNAEVAKKVALDNQLAAQIGAVSDALNVQTLAMGAKTNAKNTYDTESVRLNNEISTLLQVISLLKGLGSWKSITYLDVNRAGESLNDATAACQSQGLQLVSIQSAEHVLWLRDQLIAMGHGNKLTVGAGIPLAYDYNLTNEYFDLTDSSRSVQAIFDELRANHGFNGDYHTNQGQHYAGFGWGRNTQDCGIEDWDPNGHTTRGLICE